MLPLLGDERQAPLCGETSNYVLQRYLLQESAFVGAGLAHLSKCGRFGIVLQALASDAIKKDNVRKIVRK